MEAEGAGQDEGRPLCACHGEPLRWRRDKRRSTGGYWECVIRARVRVSRYDSSEKGKAAKARYARSEKGKAAHARHMRLSGYVTDRRRRLNARRERIVAQLRELSNGTE